MLFIVSFALVISCLCVCYLYLSCKHYKKEAKLYNSLYMMESNSLDIVMSDNEELSRLLKKLEKWNEMNLLCLDLSD